MKVFLLSAAYMHELKSLLSRAGDEASLFQAIVNAPFKTKTKGRPVGLAIVVLLLANKANNTLDRIALADTESAKGAVEYSVKPFEDIRIPLDDKKNYLLKAIRSGEPQVVADWEYLFTPELSAEEARFNQTGAGIATSVVYPLEARNGGALIFSYVISAEDISKQYHAFMRKYTALVNKSL